MRTKYWYWTAHGLIAARSDQPRPDMPTPARRYRVVYSHIHGLMRSRGCTDEEYEEAKAEFIRDRARRQDPVSEPSWYPSRERTARLGEERALFRW